MLVAAGAVRVTLRTLSQAACLPNTSSLPPGLMRRVPLEPLEKSTPATAASGSTKMEKALVEDGTVTVSFLHGG